MAFLQHADVFGTVAGYSANALSVAGGQSILEATKLLSYAAACPHLRERFLPPPVQLKEELCINVAPHPV